jgi:hypothetical protein
MRAKEIINKKIVRPIRPVCMSKSKLFLVGLVSLLGALPLASLSNKVVTAYAQQQQAQALDPWSEALRTAQAKVEAATSPGAFGNGVPDLQNWTTSDLLFVFGVVVAGSMLAYTIIKYLRNRSKEKVKRDIVVLSVN